MAGTMSGSPLGSGLITGTVTHRHWLEDQPKEAAGAWRPAWVPRVGLAQHHVHQEQSSLVGEKTPAQTQGAGRSKARWEFRSQGLGSQGSLACPGLACLQHQAGCKLLGS